MSRTSAVAALVALLLLPAAARASSSSFTVAQDVQNVPDSVWRAGTLGAQLNVSHEGNIVRVEATDGRRSARMNFAAPQGKPLAKGIYTDAHNAIGANADGRPGMDFEPSTCNFFSGDFEVKDIAFDAAGNPTRSGSSTSGTATIRAGGRGARSAWASPTRRSRPSCAGTRPTPAIRVCRTRSPLPPRRAA